MISRILFYNLLIIIVLGFVAYKNGNKKLQNPETCMEKKSSEKEDTKLKTSVPLWQSLSRQLITISR